MYHLVFEHLDRHIKSYTWSRVARQQRESTHNQFDLYTIRKSLREDWTLEGYGLNSTQKVVWEICDSVMPSTNYGSPFYRYMNGHIITVDSTDKALWFRLNIENVTKTRCVFRHMYKDLNTDDLSVFHKTAKSLNTQARANSQATSSLNDISRNLGYLYGSNAMPPAFVAEKSEEIHPIVKQMIAENQHHIKLTADNIERVKNDFEAYMAERLVA